MIITYKSGKMIVAHPSGHVDEISKKDLEKYREQLQDQTSELITQKMEIDLQIAEVEKTS